MHASAPAILASRLVVHWLSTYLCLFAQQGRAQDAGHGAEHFCYVYVDLEYFCGAYMDLEHFCAAHVCVCKPCESQDCGSLLVTLFPLELPYVVQAQRT